MTSTRIQDPAASPPRVLLVEPDREVRAMLTVVLRLERMTVTSTDPEGSDLLVTVRRWKPTVVVMEPQRSCDGYWGVEAMALIRLIDPGLPVVVFTSALNPDPERLWRQGAYAVVVKSAQDLPALLGTIRAAHESSGSATPF